MAAQQQDRYWAAGSSWLILPAVLLALVVYALIVLPLPWQVSVPWVPALDIELAIYVDGLSAFFLVLITGVGTMVFMYAAAYMQADLRSPRLFLLLSLFMLAMVGCVTADNLITLFVFWELTSIVSFLLVGFNHQQQNSRQSAQQALLVTAGGGLFLLAGFLLLGQLAGTYSIRGLLLQADHLLQQPGIHVALVLIWIGCFTKSAQFPFHFWLPNAMTAPTPVSAYLHSATMVKLGIYLLARLDPAFDSLPLWRYGLVIIGSLTAILAVTHALRERDLKRILAWSTVAALGTLTLLVGLPGPHAALAVAAFLLAHALYKAPLFFVAGNVDHGAGTRIIDDLHGMRRYMPWTAAAALLAGVSMAGIPASFGFIAKDVMTAAKSEADLFILVSAGTVLVSAVSVAVAAVAAVRIFWGQDNCPVEARLHESHWPMLVPPVAIASMGIAFGLAPGWVNPLIISTAQSMAPGADMNSLVSPWHALSGPVLITQLFAIAMGIVIYLTWDKLHQAMDHVKPLDRWGPSAWYQRKIKGIPYSAAMLTRCLQHGRLAYYTALLLAFIALSLAAVLWMVMPQFRWPDWQAVSWPVFLALGIIMVGAVTAVFLQANLLLVLISGLVGYGSALFFLFTSAPDLALTQFFIETALVVVAVTTLMHLSRSGIASVNDRYRPWHMLLALSVGLIFSLLFLLSTSLPMNETLANFFAEKSWTEAYGKNVVNVIIVDFRALDTLGEIAVVAFALLAAMPLLAGIRLYRQSIGRTKEME
jgi:multicomponent Na+:H+ antiporter subunit A